MGLYRVTYHAKLKKRTPSVVVQLNCGGVQKALAQLARGAEGTPEIRTRAVTQRYRDCNSYSRLSTQYARIGCRRTVDRGRIEGCYRCTYRRRAW
jgi:hypothetical protein